MSLLRHFAQVRVAQTLADDPRYTRNFARTSAPSTATKSCPDGKAADLEKQVRATLRYPRSMTTCSPPRAAVRFMKER